MNHGETVRPVASAKEKVTALNPMGYPPTIEQLGMAPRFESLNGKTIYLVDVHFVDGDKLLQQMQAWFAEHLPNVRTILASKAGVYTEDDPKLSAKSASTMPPPLWLSAIEVPARRRSPCTVLPWRASMACRQWASTPNLSPRL